MMNRKTEYNYLLTDYIYLQIWKNWSDSTNFIMFYSYKYYQVAYLHVIFKPLYKLNYRCFYLVKYISRETCFKNQCGDTPKCFTFVLKLVFMLILPTKMKLAVPIKKSTMQTKFLTLCVYMCAFIRECVCESEIQEIWNVNNSAYWERGRAAVVHQCNNFF